jgi:hypothetical protein
MIFKTLDEYKAALVTSPYLEGRWSYYSKVINMVKEIKPKTILEIGSNGFPLFHDSIKLEVDKMADAHVYWDITQTPWPFIDKEFDVVIALQVWEHLGNKQREAFIEARRVGKNVILSFPYKWKSGDADHLNITKDIIKYWTLDEDYILQRIVKTLAT